MTKSNCTGGNYNGGQRPKKKKKKKNLGGKSSRKKKGVLRQRGNTLVNVGRNKITNLVWKQGDRCGFHNKTRTEKAVSPKKKNSLVRKNKGSVNDSPTEGGVWLWKKQTKGVAKCPLGFSTLETREKGEKERV